MFLNLENEEYHPGTFQDIISYMEDIKESIGASIGNIAIDSNLTLENFQEYFGLKY